MNEFLMHALEKFGFPIVLLLGIFVAFWRVARWLAPRIDRLIDRHATFIDKLESEMREQTTALLEIKGEQETTRDCVREIKEAILRFTR